MMKFKNRLKRLETAIEPEEENHIIDLTDGEPPCFMFWGCTWGRGPHIIRKSGESPEDFQERGFSLMESQGCPRPFIAVIMDELPEHSYCQKYADKKCREFYAKNRDFSSRVLGLFSERGGD